VFPPLQIPPAPGASSLLVEELLAAARAVLFLLLAYWVYVDAGRRGDDEPALWATAVGGLGLVSLFAGLFALVVYVGHRA